MSDITKEQKVLLKMNILYERLDDIIKILPTMKSPTISKLCDSNYFALETVINKDDANVLIPKLKSLGAEDILELDTIKIFR